jgi:hypothetical protein
MCHAVNQVDDPEKIAIPAKVASTTPSQPNITLYHHNPDSYISFTFSVDDDEDAELDTESVISGKSRRSIKRESTILYCGPYNILLIYMFAGLRKIVLDQYEEPKDPLAKSAMGDTTSYVLSNNTSQISLPPSLNSAYDTAPSSPVNGEFIYKRNGDLEMGFKY